MEQPDIIYTKNIDNVTEDMLSGFFVGWPNPPSAATHLEILRKSYYAFVAMHHGQVVGFINAVSDGVLTAYIPLLEVLPQYSGMGIGSELVKLMLNECKDLYMIDICHDEELTPYYAKFKPVGQCCSTVFRNYSAQSGRM